MKKTRKIPNERGRNQKAMKDINAKSQEKNKEPVYIERTLKS